MIRTYARTLALLAPERGLAITLVLANLALASAQFIEPVLFGRIIDRLTESRDVTPSFGELAPLLAAWAGFGLFSILAAVVVALHADRLSHRRRLAAMARFFDHLLQLPASFHGAHHSGRLLKIMLDGAQALFSLWLSFFRENCAALSALFVLLPATLIVNWRLGLVLILLVAIFGCATALVLRRTQGLQEAVESFNAELAERASDALGNVPVIQSFTRIGSESRAVHRIIDRVLAAQLPVLSWWAVAAVATRASATLSLVAIFLFGLALHFQGLATIGVIVTFMNFAVMLVARLEQAVGFFNQLFMQKPKLTDFFAVLDEAPNVADRPGARDPGKISGAVRFEHVSFSYDPRRKALDDVSFSAVPGEKIALVGATGSGKSTTLNLLHRVFDPDSGAIFIDDIDLRDIKLSVLRKNIGVVFQEPMLFARSIEENLRVGKPDASEAEILLALERAQGADFVARQPDGIKTVIGERGRSLSGGERQRLAIARALLKNPPILIFDEATAALDAATEQKLQAALDAATKDRTTFIIAHRLATIRAVDRIFVFDQGKIVEQGSFDELVARNGRFAALARAQFLAAPAV